MKNSTDGPYSGNADFEGVLRDLTAIRAEMVAETARLQARLDEVHPHYRESARNLLHYLSLRRRDLRPLQLRLTSVGLSSLGRAESHVLATVDAVLEILHRLMRSSFPPQSQSPSQDAPVVDFAHGQQLLAEHTEGLSGRR